MPVLRTPDVQPAPVLLTNIRWSTYEALLEDLGPHPGKRITYDRGTLEIVTTSPLHEWIKTLLGRFIETMTLELAIDIRGLGMATWKRKDLERGFEPDECYYVQSEEHVRGRETIDLAQDPSPDLIVEIDISRSSLHRRRLYAAFGVTELWCFDGERVRFYGLRDGEYLESETSLSFPFLTSADLDRFLNLRSSLSETQVVTRFRDWVRANFKTP